MLPTPREALGLLLTGEILEIGPGNRPFKVAEDATVKYADRSVEGGRDANWPELIGEPDGIQAHYNLNLDTDGLSAIASNSLDGVIASHVIEHVANPLQVLEEFARVLRPAGKLLIVVPDRHHTFDSVRAPTPFSVLLAKFRAGISEVDDQTIREFCEAIYSQPSFHPPKVREWHNPAALDSTMFALHRRRSIHAHCWTPEEFAALLVSAMFEGLATWNLMALYCRENFPAGKSDEFALLLEKPSHAVNSNIHLTFASGWTSSVLSSDVISRLRIARFQEALRRDVGDVEVAFCPLSVFANTAIERERVLRQTEVDELCAQLESAQEQAAANTLLIKNLYASRSWRVTAPLRALSQLIRHQK